jgi:hypothetical protein
MSGTTRQALDNNEDQSWGRFARARAYEHRLDELAGDFDADIQRHFRKRWRFENGAGDVGAQAIVVGQTSTISRVLSANRDQISPNVNLQLLQSIMYLENCYNGTPQIVENARTGMTVTAGAGSAGTVWGALTGNIPLTVGSAIVAGASAIGLRLTREDSVLPMNVDFNRWKDVLGAAEPAITSAEQITGRGNEVDNIRAAALILTHLDRQIPAEITGDMRTALLTSLYANTELTQRLGRPIMYGGKIVEIMDNLYPREETIAQSRETNPEFAALTRDVSSNVTMPASNAAYVPPRTNDGIHVSV